MALCFKCRKEAGWEPRDNGFHTAQLATCDGCGKKDFLLPSRHFIKPEGEAEHAQKGDVA